MKLKDKIRRNLIIDPNLTAKTMAEILGYDYTPAGLPNLIAKVKSEMEGRIISRKAFGE